MDFLDFHGFEVNSLGCNVQGFRAVENPGLGFWPRMARSVN